MVPGGFDAAAYPIASITIVNDGTGTEVVSNYTYTISPQGRPDHTWKSGRIMGFRHKEKNVQYLIREVLNDALPKRRDPVSKKPLNPMMGRKHTPETIERMRKAQLKRLSEGVNDRPN